MALDWYRKSSVGRGYGPRFALGQASRLKWLLLSVPIWTSLIGLEVGWYLAQPATAQEIPVTVEGMFHEHLAVQRLARTILPERPHPNAYATLKWRIPDDERREGKQAESAQ